MNLTADPVGANLDVAAAHVVLVTLQGQVPVLGVDEADQGLAVPPALSVETQSDAAPGTQSDTVHFIRSVCVQPQFYVEASLLGDVEAFEEASDVLVGRLPRKPPRSDHRLAVHGFRLAAVGVKDTRNGIRH